MFLASKICCVSSGTVRALYCCEPRDVRGANPGMKKWRRGKGTMLTANFLRSALSWPGNRRQVVTPDIVAETKWFKSPTVIKIPNIFIEIISAMCQIYQFNFDDYSKMITHHMLVWWAWGYGSRCHTEPRCQCSRSHLCFLQADAPRG